MTAPAKQPSTALTVRPPSRSLAWLKYLLTALALGAAASAGYAYREELLAAFAPPPEAPIKAEPEPVVRVLPNGRIHVHPGTPFADKIDIEGFHTAATSAPVLTVVGSVVARLAPGDGAAENRWDFADSTVATAYADWLKSRQDVEFSQEQLGKVQELAKSKSAFLTLTRDRMKGLVDNGIDSKKALAAAEADLLQADIQGSKDVYEAQSDVRTAERSQALVERQLLQAGVDPGVLKANHQNVVLVVGEVPEAHIADVHDQQMCVARFAGYPDVVFPGKVGCLAPSVSRDRRTIRVIFELTDTSGRLRPGLFAEVGLGTEERTVLFAPADAVLHVGRKDYLLVETQTDEFRPAEVVVGEPTDDRVEILSGVKGDEKVVGRGALLLKPLLVQSLQAPPPEAQP